MENEECRFKQLFELQRKIDEFISETHGISRGDKKEWIDRLTTAMIEEAVEVKEYSDWKWWKNQRELDESALKEEMVDVLHFWLSLCVRMGWSAEEMFAVYQAKNLENFNRQKGLSTKHDADRYLPE